MRAYAGLRCSTWLPYSLRTVPLILLPTPTLAARLLSPVSPEGVRCWCCGCVAWLQYECKGRRRRASCTMEGIAVPFRSVWCSGVPLQAVCMRDSHCPVCASTTILGTHGTPSLGPTLSIAPIVRHPTLLHVAALLLQSKSAPKWVPPLPLHR